MAYNLGEDLIEKQILSNDKYNLKENWIDKIAVKHFEEENIEILNTGLFGYINEISSSAIRNSVFHKNILYDEHFPNTASLLKSLINFSKTYNFEIGRAECAKMNIAFTLTDKDVVRLGKQSSDKLQIKFVIDRRSKFSASGYVFSLKHDIEIVGTRQKITDSFIYKAYYKENDEFVLNDPFINLFQEDEYIMLTMDLYQFDRIIKKVKIYDLETIRNKDSFEVKYNNQLYDFSVNYKYLKEDVYLNKYFNDSFTPEESRYCFYQDNEDNTLNVFFSPIANTFKPAYNSELLITVYDTLGSKGNFKFNGNVSYTPYNGDEMISCIILPRTDSEGGKDKPDVLEIKSILINKLFERGILITEKDVNSYFNNEIKDRFNNNGKIEFVKKRDDVLRRSFTSFLLMKGNRGEIVPTNTIQMCVRKEDINEIESNFILKPGTALVYNEKEGYHFPTQPDDIKDTDYQNYVYTNPFLVQLLMDPFPRIGMKNTFIDSRNTFRYNEVNSSIPYTFKISNFKFMRDPMSMDRYVMRFNLINDLPQGLLDNEKRLGNKIKLFGILHTDNEMKLFEARKVEGNEYECQFETNDYVDKLGRLKIVNTFLNPFGGAPISEDFVSDCVLELGVFYNNGSSNEVQLGSFKGLDLPQIMGYDQCVSFMATEKVEFMIDMDNIIDITMDIIEDSNGNRVFHINEMPVIGLNYFADRTNYTNIYSEIKKISDLLKDSIVKLENNTSLDIKFYNTFGPSRVFKLTKKPEDISKNNTNIKVEFNIRLKAEPTKELDKNLKLYIMNFIEKLNNETEEFFAISNLIRELENKYSSYIDFIEFISLNGTANQKIEKLLLNHNNLSRERLKTYVPEYMNVGCKFTIDSSLKTLEEMCQVTINYI